MVISIPEFELISSRASQISAGRTGRLLLYADFSSRFIGPRNVNVWLPPGYAERSAARYPVIYAQDGQNLFNPATAFSGVDWRMDMALNRLVSDGVKPAIVVGVWNTGARRQEYYPQRVFEKFMSPGEQAECIQHFGLPISDLYLRFIVEELKPLIDERFSTYSDPQNTFIMGSSMGGLISAYAMCEFPEVFGAAACMSTHWPACQGKMVDYLGEHLPDPARHRFYFDYGTKSQDAMYESYQRWVDISMRKAGYSGGRRTFITWMFRKEGYRKGRNFLSEKFVGADHSESAWRRRVDIPLRFLLADR